MALNRRPSFSLSFQILYIDPLTRAAPSVRIMSQWFSDTVNIEYQKWNVGSKMWTIYFASKCLPFLLREHFYLDFMCPFHHFPGALWHRWCGVILCIQSKSISSPFHWPIPAAYTKETHWWFIWCSTNQD